ncbi:hypothetical protein BV20DRAFT_111882 [Pilatotrama ljubarskyi]|nr:hypothetical protein BV20DRAFT_111882 [Pilatotrama ljubarskyi]
MLPERMLLQGCDPEGSHISRSTHAGPHTTPPLVCAGTVPVTAMSESTLPNPCSMPPHALASLPKPPALDNTFGAVLLGTFLAMMLFGLNLHQTYRYFRLYPEDSRGLKCLVMAVELLDILTSICSMHLCYHSLVTNYFNPEALLYGVWSINLGPLISGLYMVTAQSFFVRRAWTFGPNFRPVVITAVLLCIAELGFLSAATAEACIVQTFQRFHKYAWLVSTGAGLAVAADGLLTIALIMILHRSRTGRKRTDSMIDVLIIYTLNTGLITGAFNTLTLLFALIRPGDLIYAGFGIPGVKLYATTLLAALNSRQSIAARGFGMSVDTTLSACGGSAALPTHALRFRVQTTSEHVPHTRTTEDSTSFVEFGDTLSGSVRETPQESKNDTCIHSRLEDEV